MAQPEAPLPSDLNDPDDETPSVSESPAAAADAPDAKPSPIPPAKPAAAPAAPQGRGWRSLSLLLLVVLVLCLGGLAQQMRRASMLGSQVAALSTELAETRAEVAVYETRMEHVKSELGDVLVKVGLLHEFVSAPTSPAIEELVPASDPDALMLETPPVDAAPIFGATPLE